MGERIQPNILRESGADSGSKLRRILTRRRFLAASSAVAGLLAFGRRRLGGAQSNQESASEAVIVTGDPSVEVDGVTYFVPEDPTKVEGVPFSEIGFRSPFITSARELDINPDNFTTQTDGLAWAPLQDFYGVITPSDLHYQVNHGGTSLIDPSQHQLLIHGLVDRPTVYTLDDIKRFPSFSRVMFLECAGNSFQMYGETESTDTVQNLYGLTSTSEWTGVEMSRILAEVGVQPEATWVLAEGADGAVMTRSVPVEKMRDDAFIAYGQNGEPIRPEQGYPFRLMLPGWEGNTNIKWLRRLEFSTSPFETYEETRQYTDPLTDGQARQFTYPMEAKSVITWPSGGHTIPGPGFWQMRGIAWSGRGIVTRVEVSTDNGLTWADAEIEGPVRPISHTRFLFDWEWDGNETVILSRAYDETGYVQPTVEQLLQVRGDKYFYHMNGILPWKVASDGSVTNGLA